MSHALGEEQEEAARPHLAIEVFWTSGSIDKLEIYRKLGVREVWVWRRGQIEAHVLRGEGYERVPASEVLPGVDLDVLARLVDTQPTSKAMRDYRSLLRGATEPVEG